LTAVLLGGEGYYFLSADYCLFLRIYGNKEYYDCGGTVDTNRSTRDHVLQRRLTTPDAGVRCERWGRQRGRGTRCVTAQKKAGERSRVPALRRSAGPIERLAASHVQRVHRGMGTAAKHSRLSSTSHSVVRHGTICNYNGCNMGRGGSTDRLKGGDGEGKATWRSREGGARSRSCSATEGRAMGGVRHKTHSRCGVDDPARQDPVRKWRGGIRRLWRAVYTREETVTRRSQTETTPKIETRRTGFMRV
jgi:hypothetical protein